MFDDVASLTDYNITGVDDNLDNTILNDPFADNSSVTNDEAQNEIEHEIRAAENHMDGITDETDSDNLAPGVKITGVQPEAIEITAEQLEKVEITGVQPNEHVEDESTEVIQETHIDNEAELEDDETNAVTEDDANISDEDSIISEIDEDDDDVMDDGAIEIKEDDVSHPTSLTPSVQRVYGLRPHKKRHYSYVHQALTHIILTQYSLKQGLAKFQERGEEAVRKELQQLHDKGTFIPISKEELTQEQRNHSIGSLMLLKEKGCGRLKARACANGSMQRSIYAKEDAASPTVSVESVLMSCVIDAEEERHVAVTDIPGSTLTEEKMESRCCTWS